MQYNKSGRVGLLFHVFKLLNEEPFAKLINVLLNYNVVFKISIEIHHDAVTTKI